MKLRTKARRGRIIFITGTDTGVGKTVFTGLLLHHLRKTGVHALALKPFCSGSREDVELLETLQDSELTADEINPYFFSDPVAPLVGARKDQRKIDLSEVVKYVEKTAVECEVLLIEGAGGLLVPLVGKLCIGDLIARLKCEVTVVAKNRLGTVNHTLLTARVLRDLGVKKVRFVMMENAKTEKADISTATNVAVLREFLSPAQVYELEFLGKNPIKNEGFENNYKKVKKTLAGYLR